MARYRIGIDVGGTFTDIVSLDQESKQLKSVKALTTPDDLTRGVMEAIKMAGVAARDVEILTHGYTVAVNALLQRAGAKAGLLTTAGFCDLMDAGRCWRGMGPQLYDPSWIRPLQERSMVERYLRREIHERIDADGKIVVPLDEGEVRSEVEFLKQEGVEAIAICFINSYVNPQHEQRAAEIVREVFPEAYIQTSAVNLVSKESERTNTVVADAYVGPVVARYLKKLEGELKKAGYLHDVWILQMTGGVKNIAKTMAMPIYALSSGPIGGALGAKLYSKRLGVPNMVTLDIGGTTTDMAIIKDGELGITGEFELETAFTLLMENVEVHILGTGGGSIISLDKLGAPRVGPRSAGVRPGPACYGFGGVEPALSDAFLQEGLLDPELFWGGRLKLDRKAVEKALRTVATPLKISIDELAAMAHRLACVEIVERMRSIATYKGIDLREFTLLCFGSAGPMVACEIAELTNIPQVMVPLYPGCFSALGMIIANPEAQVASAPMKLLSEMTTGDMEEGFRKLDEEVITTICAQGFAPDKIKLSKMYYGMYYGQTWDNRTSAPEPPYDAGKVSQMTQAFHERYLQTYGYKAEELPIVVTQLVAVGTVEFPPFELSEIAGGKREPPVAALLKRGKTWLKGQLSEKTPFYWRADLLAGNIIEGRSVVLEEFATTVIPEGWVATVDQWGNLDVRIV